MAAGAKKVRRLGGDDYNTKTTTGVPLNPVDVAVAIKQLQDSLNELITRFNAHTHGGVTVGAGSTGGTSAPVTGTAQTATNLFVSPDQTP